MLKVSTLYILCMLSIPLVRAQNLVPNPGFEDYNACPQARSAIHYSEDYSDFPTAKWWVSALWNTTPDYYNTCATNPLVTLPYNTYNDYQQPHGGVACAGISMLSGWPATPQVSDYREYLETRLSEPLVAGKKYFVSFFVNMTYHLPESANQIVIDLVGARLTDTQLRVSYPFGTPELFIPGPPDIYNKRNTFIKDTAKWEHVKGFYIAHGGEQWMTVGYFKDSLPLNYINIYETYPGFPDSIHSTCYMYVDDVCVSEVPPPTHDTLYVQSFPSAISSIVPGVRYVWNTGDSVQTITAASPGTFWVESSGDCLYRTDTITVLCQTDSGSSNTTTIVSSFPIEISGSISGGTHSWSTGATTPGIIVTSPGTYWVESYGNCEYAVDTITILCEPDVYSDTLIYVSSFPVEVSGNVEGDSIVWSNSDTAIKTSVMQPGSYTVTVWQGCQRYIHTIQVLQRDMDDCIWVPSAFTPNGDGKNDRFGPLFSCYTVPVYYDFRIYNRFGECVFQTDDINEKWDGTFRWTQQDIGAYYYMLRYSNTWPGKKVRFNTDGITVLKGDLTLLR